MPMPVLSTNQHNGKMRPALVYLWSNITDGKPGARTAGTIGIGAVHNIYVV